jgi:hypothetical protein
MPQAGSMAGLDALPAKPAMLIPLHLIPVPAEEPSTQGDPGHAWQATSCLQIAPGLRLGDIRELGLTVAGPTSGPVGTRELMRFGQLMADAGLPLQPTRMLYDRAYAFDRLAEGASHGHEALRTLAEQLFDAYQGAGEWIGLVH